MNIFLILAVVCTYFLNKTIWYMDTLKFLVNTDHLGVVVIFSNYMIVDMIVHRLF